MLPFSERAGRSSPRSRRAVYSALLCPAPEITAGRALPSGRRSPAAEPELCTAAALSHSLSVLVKRSMELFVASPPSFFSPSASLAVCGEPTLAPPARLSRLGWNSGREWSVDLHCREALSRGSRRRTALGAPLMERRNRRGSTRAALFNPSSPASETQTTTSWNQKFIELPALKRGCHIITAYIRKGAPEIEEYSVGLAHIFVMHTSCSLTINENASPDVPLDMEDSLNRIVPEGDNYRHLDEGYDDMPAHVKASLMGSSLTVPIADGRLALGTWQGIWLNEHRDWGGSRRLVITIQGVKKR